MPQEQSDWLRVPVGDEARRWASRGRCRRVLLVVHNVTSATRLLDVLPLFRDDLRVQLLATCTGSSPFQAGTAELLHGLGIPVLPWEQALATPVDLAIAASFGGQLPEISGDLTVLSHGVGYNKKLASREPGAGSREPGAGVFGLSEEWLLAGGRPVADVMVLSHPEQLARLRAACPEAASTAVLAGDPCYDRLLAAAPHRGRFRRALGVRREQRLVLINSTWNPEALFGDGGSDVLPRLLPALTAELPADEYRVAAVLHPNIWHGHGPGQIRMWLDGARRAGLALVDPLHDWRQALIAADLVLGDFGSVSYYAAALRTPVLLGATHLPGLGADSPVADFVRRAPRFDPHAPLRPQLTRVLTAHEQAPADPAEFVSSDPGRSAELLRRTFYSRIGIPEPAGRALLDPLRTPAYDPPRRTAPMQVVTQVTGPGEVSVTRHAGLDAEPVAGGQAHTAVHEDTLDPSHLSLADVVLRHGEPDDPRFGPPTQWAAEVLARHRHCALAAYVTGPGSCIAVSRGRAPLLLTAREQDAADPAAYASALHAWLASGKELAELDGVLAVRTGTAVHRVEVAEEVSRR
ncbi:hypothetical protein DSC45_06010 [Streptomyces sp. YIM 130001]|uniref:hypothetical protein n=1 Tax=Streptomyces sp. YIM 130001 TaxID=2259644 RepID=UPI000ED848C9|nr:hypothetical protein [Streptomyces sp. YIM 130001]RII19548.1 hypothetical protein DSC45_06010 [Streptomyces sp. YIM 130001]